MRQTVSLLPCHQHWGSCPGGILLPVSDKPGINKTEEPQKFTKNKLKKPLELRSYNIVIITSHM